MTVGQFQRRDPHPVARPGEVALVVLAGAVLALGLAALAGLGAAGAVFGGGWVWPAGTAAMTRTVGGLLTGHPGRGLPAGPAHRLPGGAAVYGCVAAAEVLTATLGVLLALTWLRWRRPGDACGGMATRREARLVLGVGRLRAARALIRPDLAGRDPR